MQKEILINVESQEKRVAVVEGGVLEEYYVERPSEITMAGNIYKGVVKSVVSGIGAAFVDISYEKNGFLYVSDMLGASHDFDLLEENGSGANVRRPRPKPSEINKLAKPGQEVLVQVVKESIGNKGPRLTTHIGIPGRFIVLVPFDHHIGISKKVTDREERGRMYKILKKIEPDYKMGLIVRTAGIGKTEQEFKREARYLSMLWSRIRHDADKVKAPGLVYEERGLTFRILRDIFKEDVSRVLVDDREEYKRLRHFANSLMPAMKRKLMFYKERTHLFDSRGIEKEIERLYSKKIELKCKGYIFIEETEGLIAIDVNSGSFSRKRMEDTAFRVNLEAAAQIARHIRLRDIGGIIVIDFIDMIQQNHRHEIFNTLLNAVKRDKARITILKMSEFGIVEMTRQRVRRGVKKLSYQNCPYCGGRGSVKSATTMAINVLRDIKKELEKARIKEISAYVHPNVANYLLNEDRPSITRLEHEHRAKVVIIADPEMHVEDFRIQI
ncbi:MAG: Rne/Rng family ribonuclease [Candidatus Omnitrophota bacterium]